MDKMKRLVFAMLIVASTQTSFALVEENTDNPPLGRYVAIVTPCRSVEEAETEAHTFCKAQNLKAAISSTNTNQTRSRHRVTARDGTVVHDANNDSPKTCKAYFDCSTTGDKKIIVYDGDFTG